MEVIQQEKQIAVRCISTSCRRRSAQRRWSPSRTSGSGAARVVIRRWQRGSGLRLVAVQSRGARGRPRRE